MNIKSNLKGFSVIILSLISFQVLGFQEVPLTKIKGGSLKISELNKGPTLIVNIATKCGLTGQLDDLEKLYQKYKHQGFTVVGIPSNDFMGQTPEGNEEVAEFCRLKYGVSFPLIEKMVVKGEKKSAFYQQLIKSSSRPDDEISWNFEKFLLNSKGEVVARFSPQAAPLNGEVEEKLKSLVK